MPYRNPMLAQSVNSMMGALFGDPQAELQTLGTVANARRAAAAAGLDELAYGARTGFGDAVDAGGDVNAVLRAMLAQAGRDPDGIGRVAPDLMSAYGGIPEVAAVLGEGAMSNLATMTGTQSFGNTATGQGRALASDERMNSARIAGANARHAATLGAAETTWLDPETGRLVSGPASLRPEGAFGVPTPDAIKGAAGARVLNGDPTTMDVIELAGADNFVAGQQRLLNTRAEGEEDRLTQADLTEQLQQRELDQILNALLPDGSTALTTAGDAVGAGAVYGSGTGTNPPYDLAVGDGEIRAVTGATGGAGAGADLTDFSTADRAALAETLAAVQAQMGASEMDPRLATQVVAEARRVALARGIDIYRALDEVLGRLEVEEFGSAWGDGEFAGSRLVLRPEAGVAPAGSPEAAAVLGGGVEAESALAQAREALAKGADRARVEERLRSLGIDPGRL